MKLARPWAPDSTGNLVRLAGGDRTASCATVAYVCDRGWHAYGEAGDADTMELAFNSAGVVANAAAADAWLRKHGWTLDDSTARTPTS